LDQDRLDDFMTLVIGASRSVTRLKGCYMSNYGLGSTHTMCIRKLYASKEGLTRTQLAESCELDKAQVSRIINELCARGYVIETEENINYKKSLKLTPMGKDIAEEINSLVLKINSYVSKDFTPEEIKVFYRVFDVICERLKESEDIIDSDVENISKARKRRV
jgi:MarR family transcriptional regulator for hemolysin